MNERGQEGRRVELGRVGEGSLDRASIDRIAAQISREGPGVVRRARRVMIATRAGGVAAVLVIAGVIFLRPRELQVVSPQPVPVAARGPACEGWSAPVARAARDGLELGARGVVAIDDGTDLRATRLEPCLIVLALDEGRAVVRAGDLGGGGLEVVTPSGTARVRGTVFAIEHRASIFKVEVEEGVVEVEQGSVKKLLRAGEMHVERRSAAKVVPKKKDPPAPLEPLAPLEPEPTAEDLFKAAADARKRGELDQARLLYQRSGRAAGGAATAEAAWITLARLELETSRPREALAALREHERSFGAGALAIERAWLEVKAFESAGERSRAIDAASELVRRWPDSAQARAAKTWLEGQPR